MAVDVYTCTRALQAALCAEGLGGWADGLGTCVESGSTGTEVLMGLRWVLAELRTGRTAVLKSVVQDVDRLLAGLDAALSPSP